MKVLITLQLAAGVASWTLPRWHLFDQLPIHSVDADASGWPDLEDLIADAREKMDRAMGAVKGDVFPDFFDEADVNYSDDFLDVVGDGENDDGISAEDVAAFKGGPHVHNVTIYEFLKKAKFATNFTALLEKDKDLVKLLNSTKSNSTLFVPIDSAFRRIPHKGGKKPPEEFLAKLLRYHAAGDAYFGRDLFPMHTVPTLLDEEMLGGEPQRLRVRATLLGTYVNFYSRVVVANMATKNGAIHFVNHILVPPPFAGRELSLFPSTFSTLLLAYEKTGFVDKVVHKMKTTGGTVLAPSNAAFHRLGPAANAFLFNSPRGLKCLEALLKYQIVPNVTLYSDAKYEAADSRDGDDDAVFLGGEEEEEGTKNMPKLVKMEHFKLPTLLEKPVWVTVKRFHGIITSMTVNRWVGIKFQDAIAKNAVIHVTSKVPIPPHKHKHGKDDEDDKEEMTVEELEERLAPYIDGEEENVNVAGGEL